MLSSTRYWVHNQPRDALIFYRKHKHDQLAMNGIEVWRMRMFDPASLQLLTVLNKEVSYRSSLHRAENKFTQVKRKLNPCTADAETGCFSC